MLLLKRGIIRVSHCNVLIHFVLFIFYFAADLNPYSHVVVLNLCICIPDRSFLLEEPGTDWSKNEKISVTAYRHLFVLNILENRIFSGYSQDNFFGELTLSARVLGCNKCI